MAELLTSSRSGSKPQRGLADLAAGWDGFSVEAEEAVAGSDGRYVVMPLR